MKSPHKVVYFRHGRVAARFSFHKETTTQNQDDMRFLKKNDKSFVLALAH